MVSELVGFPEVLLKMAARGDDMPDGYDYPEQQFYEMFLCLYERYHAGAISREEATGKGRKLNDQYRVFKSNWDRCEADALLRAKTGEARAAYRKNRTLENADALILAMEGIAI